MLLAEIKKKLGRVLQDAAGGEEPATEYFDYEDVLTSNVFGALRYLDPRYGLEPVLRDLGLPPITSAGLTVWEAEDGCEPDVIIDLGHSLVVVEAKLRAPFGVDQLPREVRYAHRRARGRPWRLLCVTAHATEPLYLGTTLAKGVASWFAEDNELGLPPSEIERRIAWMPWYAIASRLEESVRSLAPPASAIALIDDLLTSLRGRGLTRLPFHGFGRIPTMVHGWKASPWREARAAPPPRQLTWRVPPLTGRWEVSLFTACPQQFTQFTGFGAAGSIELHRFGGWFSSHGGGTHG